MTLIQEWACEVCDARVPWRDTAALGPARETRPNGWLLLQTPIARDVSRLHDLCSWMCLETLVQAKKREVRNEHAALV